MVAVAVWMPCHGGDVYGQLLRDDGVSAGRSVAGWLGSPPRLSSAI